MRLSILLIVCASLTTLVYQVFGATVTAEEVCESGLSKCSDDIIRFFDCAEGQQRDRACAPGSVCILEEEKAICKLSDFLANLAKESEIQERGLNQETHPEDSADSLAIEEYVPEDDSDEHADDKSD